MGTPEFRASVLFPEDEPNLHRVHSRKVFGQLVFLTLVLLSAGIGALTGLVFVYSSDLPQVRALADFRPDVMTELFADDGTPIGSFALERRVMVNYGQIPPMLRDAVLSVEDRHFESHWGIDILRIVRAGLTDILEWRKVQGASTLTQQLSRMLFLTPEKSFRRKFQEILLAIQIERRFTKPQIFTMYANQVPLGHGNFGFAAAAQFYLGKSLNELTLPECALLAGLPKTPTAYSPLLHPERALMRRNQVLSAMLENGKIARAQYLEAKEAPLGLNIQRWSNTIAPYFVEDVRQLLEKKYGTEAVHEKGLRVYTTLNTRWQQIAERVLQEGLREYDKRHGWRGGLRNILKDAPVTATEQSVSPQTYSHDDWKTEPKVKRIIHGLVVEVKPTYAIVRFGDFSARLTPADFAWTGRSRADELLAPGDVAVFEVKEVKGQALRVTLEQRPEVQGALVAIENATGAVKAMVGGYNFEESKFNRARQAERQSGSSFKVYVYAQGLIDGLDPFDTILDSPVSYVTASGSWSPRNYDLKYKGDITLLRALAESRNVPAVRLLSRVGVERVIRLCRKFGITSRLVPNLPLALGASDLTLLEHTSAFSTFPNDGVHIAPRLITRVTTYDGRVIDDYPPEVTDVLPAGVARLMVSMLREVFNSGTAVGARDFARAYPVAGKTGTTNDFTDASFIGFSPWLTCGVWVGFDDRRSLGQKEEGSTLALPIWKEFMAEVLKDRPLADFSHSPLLSNPEQVKQILVSAEPERLLTAGVVTSSVQPASARPASPRSQGQAAPSALLEAGSRSTGTSSSSTPAPDAAAGPSATASKSAGKPADAPPAREPLPPTGQTAEETPTASTP